MIRNEVEIPGDEIKNYLKQFDILYFFSRNPEAVFSIAANTADEKDPKSPLWQAINDLIEKGIIRQEQGNKGFIKFRLADQQSHEYIKNMQILTRYLKKHQNEVESVSRAASLTSKSQA